MALNAVRLQQIKDAWSGTVKRIVRGFLIRLSRHEDWGPFPVPTTHTADLYDDQDVQGNNLDEYVEVPYTETDESNQTGTDEFGNPIYGTRPMRGATWRNFGAFLTWAVDQGHITAADRTLCIQFFRLVRVLRIQSLDARTSEKLDQYGWDVTLALKARDDDLRYVRTVRIWAGRPDTQDDDVDTMEPEEVTT